MNRGVNGSLGFIGTIRRDISKRVAGVLAMSGALSGSKVIQVLISAVLSFTGTLSKRPEKNISGSLSFIGGLRKRLDKLVRGVLNTLGSLVGIPSTGPSTPVPAPAYRMVVPVYRDIIRVSRFDEIVAVEQGMKNSIIVVPPRPRIEP